MTAPAVLCPQCTSTVTGGDEFCPVCGDFLGWRPDAAPADLVVRPAPAPEVAAQPVPEADPLRRYREESAAADARAQAAQAAAAKAQVRLERTRRRSSSARRRLERLAAELPDAERRASEAAAAAERAAAGARRATGAAEGTTGPRKDELRKRAREAARAEARAQAASRQAQEAVATLNGVLRGVRAEVAGGPAETTAAKAARDAARADAAAALSAAAAAAAELALQERLLQLRATPRRVVALPESDEREMRAQAQQEADQAARDAERRAGAAERRQRRRAEREDERRDRAEQQSDQRELGEVLQSAGVAERAAQAAEQAVRTVEPGPEAAPEEGLAGTSRTSSVSPLEDDPRQPAALPPVEVRRRVRRAAVPLVATDDGPLLCRSRSCGVGNAEGRHLCRRCGTDLAVPPAEPPPPPLVWWRRLLRLGPPRPRDEVFVPAGARPVPGGNRRTAAAVRRARVGGTSALRRGLPAGLLAVAAVLALLLVALLTPLGRVVTDALSGGSDEVRRRVALVETPVVPLSTRASGTARTSAPALAVDGDPLTSWTADRAPGSGTRLGLALPGPTDLVAVRLTAAAGTGRPRPASVTVHSVGNPPVVLRLRDTLQPQRLPLRLRGVADVRIRLDDLYPGAGRGLAAGFAEVELLTRAPRAFSPDAARRRP